MMIRDENVDWGTKDEVLAAVKQDGYKLRNASKVLQDDDDVVLAAVEQTSGGFRHASERLKNDKKFTIEVLKKSYNALTYVSEDLIPLEDKFKYFDFLDNDTNLDALLENTNLADDFKHKLVLTFAEIKIKREFEKICDERGIKIDDDIPKSIEDTFKEKMAETTATIEFKAEEDNKEAIKAIQNIKI